MDELFPVEQVTMDSPLLAWKKRHGVITYRSSQEPVVWFAGLQIWWPDAKDSFSFFAKETGHNGGSRIGEGDTEDEAILSLLTCWDCRRNGIEHWTVENKT